MDQFKQAVNLARGTGSGSADQQRVVSVEQSHVHSLERTPEPRIKEFALSERHLESMRIVSHSNDDPRVRSYEMLRTQVLQSLDKGGWQILAVTSPTPGCGKTVTACNLALSIARLPDRSVILVDLDMRRPRAATYLGVKQKQGVLSVLENRQTLLDSVIQLEFGKEHLAFLPGEATKASAEWMSSPAMTTMLQNVKREFRSRIIILDLPPILASDDVLSILPQLESVLLVTAAGSSSIAEIKECTKHLRSTPVVRVVVNKITEREPAASYYEYH